MGRLHDKYLIVDEAAYVLGGRNTYDYFLGDQPGHKNYDWDVLVWAADGKDSLLQLACYFQQVWNSGVCTSFPSNAPWGKQRQVREAYGELALLYQRMQEEHPAWFRTEDYERRTVPVRRIRLLSNPTTRYAKEPVVCYGMTELMAAGKRVSLHTPYVICNHWMLERLKRVCAQAEQVSLMTNSVANNGNPFGAMDYQTHRGSLRAAGLRLMEYDSGISYHGKCAVVDDRISMVGSFNFDMRSAYIDTELMLVLDSEMFCRILRNSMSVYERDAIQTGPPQASPQKQTHVPQAISRQKQRKLLWTRWLLGWARFLM